MQLNQLLRDRLQRVLSALESFREPSEDDLINTMEVMALLDQYYSPEQLALLEQRRHELGQDGLARGQEAWRELIAEVKAQPAAGTDPADPAVQELARRWMGLVEEMTGGDPRVRHSLMTMWQQEGAEKVTQGAVSNQLASYIGRAFEAARPS